MSLPSTEKIELHLHAYVKKIVCPFNFSVNSLGDTASRPVEVYLSRQKIEIDKNTMDIKYYYNCLYAEACREERCIWRRSQIAYEKTKLEKVINISNSSK